MGPLLGTMLRQNGPPPKLSKVTFFRIFYPSEKHAFLEDRLRTLGHSLGTLLGPFWVHFGKFLEAKIDANIDPGENVKNAFRLDENQKSKI